MRKFKMLRCETGAPWSLLALYSCVSIGLLTGHGCLDTGTTNTTSDVACLTANAWPSSFDYFLDRPEAEGSGTWLFTAQTFDDAQTDLGDGERDYIPHQPVYRYDSESESFSRVDDSVWDQAEGFVSEGCPSLVDEGSFRIDNGSLFFKGSAVPVAGGVALDIIDPQVAIDFDGPVDFPLPNVVAVLSTDGVVEFLFGSASGQHYHQLFSKDDGTSVGPALRLGVGGMENSRVFGCWTIDQEYVVYDQGTETSTRFCVVPVAETLSELEGE